MSHCSLCRNDLDPDPPNAAYWVVAGMFWLVSILFGIGATLSTGWEFLLFVTWALFAASAGVLVRRATSWSCNDCGAALPPPLLRPSFFVNAANAKANPG